jgi:hypothetical protein
MHSLSKTGIKSVSGVVAAQGGQRTIRHPRPVARLLGGALFLAALGGGAIGHEGAAVAYEDVGGLRVTNPLADSVREANDRFADVAVALKEGYAPIPCVSGIDGGAMGIHYVNGDLINDEKIDIAHPEAVMYEPQSDGNMKLVAVEYITPKGPAELGGHLFSFTNAPNRYGLPAFYELHVWAWRANPTGAFADMNPAVSCDEAPLPK